MGNQQVPLKNLVLTAALLSQKGGGLRMAIGARGQSPRTLMGAQAESSRFILSPRYGTRFSPLGPDFSPNYDWPWDPKFPHFETGNLKKPLVYVLLVSVYGP
jgi:hypothetical protein